MKIYGDARSGNCYKLQLTCGLLGLPYQWQPVDVLAGETRSEAFLARSPNGKIPVLELDDGRILSESNAIVNYLARGSRLLPSDDFLLARLQQWQFFEQYSHEPTIAVARFIALYQGRPPEREAQYQALQAPGHRALAVMEQQLAATPFLVGDDFSCADICLFAYTHVAGDGGFDLSRYPAIQRWLQQVAGQPGFCPMAA